jgi:UDP:flavonoid glycosyltransferase YjiC (YdhE family)
VKFLLTTLTSDDLGLLARTVPVAVELARRGHTVAFCNPAPAPSRLLADAGLENLLPRHPLFYLNLATDAGPRGLLRLLRSPRVRRDFGGPWPFLRDLARALPLRIAPPTPEVWNMDHLWALAGMLNENFVRAYCEAFLALLRAYAPDVVVDSWNPFAVIAARALGLPVVTITQADGHPASRGFIWWRTAPARIPSPAPAVNRVLAGYGLPPVHTLAEFNAGARTLVVGAPETDPLPDSAGVTYVGALLWQAADAALPEWLDTWLPERPLVWLYAGNPQYFPVRTALDSLVVLETCVAALAGEHVRVVLTTGHHALPRALRTLPPNFRCEPYLPGLALARRSALLIHHGGYGSCQTGLYAGTPAVIIPTYSERESNARRVVATGAGEFLVPQSNAWGGKRISTQTLRATVRRVLADPAYAVAAQRASAALQRYGGATLAADVIESVK